MHLGFWIFKIGPLEAEIQKSAFSVKHKICISASSRPIFKIQKPRCIKILFWVRIWCKIFCWDFFGSQKLVKTTIFLANLHPDHDIVQNSRNLPMSRAIFSKFFLPTIGTYFFSKEVGFYSSCTWWVLSRKITQFWPISCPYSPYYGSDKQNL